MADLAAKQIIGTGGTEMIRDAVNIVKAFKGTPQQKAELLEEFAKQIGQRTGGSWSAVRQATSDGSVVIAGELGEASVINSAGQIFSGSLQRGNFLVGEKGISTPIYETLKKIE